MNPIETDGDGTMTGADVGHSFGRPEYVIPSLDLEGFFARFFAERDECLERLASDRNETEADLPPDPEPGIADTAGWIRSISAHPEKAFESPWIAGTEALQKKFAVFGTLHARYAAGFRKDSETECPPSAFCLLAALFLRRFTTDSDWNALNSAIKMLDKAIRSWKAGSDDPFLADCLGSALRTERSILEGLVRA